MSNLLKTILGPLELNNPVIVASGTFGYGVEYADVMDVSRLGGVSVKGISLEPRLGNPPPRVCETPSGMLNSIGLANIGYDKFVGETMPKLREMGVTVIVNTYGTSAEEFAELARRFDDVEGIAALEVNISCPNVKAGGIHFGFSGKPASEVTSAVRGATRLPVIVKLSPEATDLQDVARAVQDAGADAISMINTMRGMCIDVETRKPRLGGVMGGMSGPAIRPLAVRMVYQVYQAIDIPIIGMGGINCLRDALEFFLAGASAIQIGTANYSDPTIGIKIIDELQAYCEQRGVKPSDLVGKVVVG